VRSLEQVTKNGLEAALQRSRGPNLVQHVLSGSVAPPAALYAQCSLSLVLGQLARIPVPSGLLQQRLAGLLAFGGVLNTVQEGSHHSTQLCHDVPIATTELKLAAIPTWPSRARGVARREPVNMLQPAQARAAPCCKNNKQVAIAQCDC
jgi:hypothetical protein